MNVWLTNRSGDPLDLTRMPFIPRVGDYVKMGVHEFEVDRVKYFSTVGEWTAIVVLDTPITKENL